MNMASCASFRLFLTILVIFPFSGGHFDFAELNSIHYGIEIMGTPVIAEENTSPGSVMLTSIYGQPYQCAYPDQQAEVEREKEEEKAAEELGISHLLKPMEISPCLIHSKDWWTYEFCYGKVIKQYHVENGVPSGDIITLGLYESEFDWNNETEQVKRNRLNRYHSQQYVNGTLCDLTGKPRRAEVRFQCEDGVGDYIARIDEMATCVYILTVRTTKICHHPYLKPPVTKKPLSITCSPLLSAEEYAEYQTAEAEKKARRERFSRQAFRYVDFDNAETIERTIEEQTAKWAEKKKLEEMKNKGGAEDQEDAIFEEADSKDDPQENKELNENEIEETSKGRVGSPKEGAGSDEAVVNKMADEIQKVLIETLAKELQGHLDKAGDADELSSEDEESDEDTEEDKQPDSNIKFETVEGSDLRKAFSVDQRGEERDESEGFIRIKMKPAAGVEDHGDSDLEGSESDFKEESSDTETQAPKTGPPANQDDVTVETEDDEAIEEFEKGLGDIRRQRRLARLAKYRETLNSAMQAQFNTIVDEATQELQNEGMEGEVNKPEAFKQLASTLSKLLSRLERTEEDIQTIEEKIASKVKQAKQMRKKAEAIRDDRDDDGDYDDDEVEDEAQHISEDETLPTEEHNEEEKEKKKELLQSETGTPQDGRVKVRITRIKQTPDGKKETDGLTGSGAQLKLPAEQKEKLENSVQQELQKAGLDTAGGKVEVRIITAGYYNKHDDSVTILSEEDSSAFNRMIVTILGGGDAEEKESERQRKLQENYGFTWKKDKKSRTISPPQ